MLYITSFHIKYLNGIYSYSDCKVNPLTLDTVIIYGDNGSGKTTILNLIFHLLSSAEAKGHLTAISKVPFKSVSVELSDGTTISAERRWNGDSTPINFSIKNKKIIASYTFIPTAYKDRILQEHLEKELWRTSRINRTNRTIKINENQIKFFIEKDFIVNNNKGSHEEYISALKSLNLTCYLITTDRLVKCDEIENQKASAYTFKFESNNDKNIVSEARSLILQDAINKASSYTNRKIIESSKDGSQNTNEIFIQLISKIAETLPQKNKSKSNNIDEFDPELALNNIKSENDKFFKKGLLPEINSEDLISLYKNSKEDQRTVLLKLISSYIDTIRARHNTLEPITKTIEIFLRSLNKLFNHKELSFSPSAGFTIKGFKKELLVPSQLSSGEQQLLLMFCYLLASNEHNAIFMIDEPEISLNVKWQRMLIDAMRDISKHSNKQLIVATHSIELLTQYIDSVVQLTPEISNNENKIYEHTEKND